MAYINHQILDSLRNKYDIHYYDNGVILTHKVTKETTIVSSSKIVYVM